MTASPRPGNRTVAATDLHPRGSSKPEIRLLDRLIKFQAALAEIAGNPRHGGVNWRAIDKHLTAELLRMVANDLCKPSAGISRKIWASVRRSDAKEQLAAQRLLQMAVQSGRVIKPEICSACHRKTTPKTLHGHHADYAAPYDVTWLCRDCHRSEHASTVYPKRAIRVIGI